MGFVTKFFSILKSTLISLSPSPQWIFITHHSLQLFKIFGNKLKKYSFWIHWIVRVWSFLFDFNDIFFRCWKFLCIFWNKIIYLQLNWTQFKCKLAMQLTYVKMDDANSHFIRGSALIWHIRQKQLLNLSLDTFANWHCSKSFKTTWKFSSYLLNLCDSEMHKFVELISSSKFKWKIWHDVFYCRSCHA